MSLSEDVVESKRHSFVSCTNGREIDIGVVRTADPVAVPQETRGLS